MKYVSKRSELALVKNPTDRIIDEQRRVIVRPGVRVEFFAHHYETHDPELIEWLHNHPERGRKFHEITSDDEQAIEKARALAKGEVPKVVTGPMVAPAPVEVKNPEPYTRPTDTTAISPELIRVIDERVNAALEVIVNLLKDGTEKEAKMMAPKPIEPFKAEKLQTTGKKTFKCPYCAEIFVSGFEVGRHKKVCTKRPQ